MKMANLIEKTARLPYFDLQTLLILSGEKKRHLLTQLYQWSQKGLVIPLKRGVYTLASPYRQASLSPLTLANELYHPSYLSTDWALSYYGIIPEKVTCYTSITTRVTRHFENSFGLFDYSTIKKGLFWGFETKKIGEEKIRIALPEKALLDLLYLEEGTWTKERLAEMRFDSHNLDFEKLKELSKKSGSPRLEKIVAQMILLLTSTETGWRNI